MALQMLEVSTWSGFKTLCITNKALNIQYVEYTDHYEIYAVDSLVWHITLLRPSADATDFDSNYKATANARLNPGTILVDLAGEPIVVGLGAAAPDSAVLIGGRDTTSWTPAYKNFDAGTLSAVTKNVDGTTVVRGTVLTDEFSFRDDFTQGALYVDLAGTCTFTNGSTTVTGSGTAFLTNVNKWHHIKLSSHADSNYAVVADVLSDTELVLASAYTGANGSGTGRLSYWRYNIETGGSAAQVSSELGLASGTTNGTKVQAIRTGDYLPYTIGCTARISNRRANQEAHVGLADGGIGTSNCQALIVWDGTDDTKVKLRTGFSSLDIEETTVTLPGGLVSSTAAYYQLEIGVNRVELFVNDTWLATHKLHVPGPYNAMDCHICIVNTGIPAGSTTLYLDTFFLTNFNQIQIGSVPKGDPIPTKDAVTTISSASNVAAAMADTLLSAASPLKAGTTVQNDSTATMYLKLGTGAGPTSYTALVKAGGYYETPFRYTGAVSAYWSAATGSARVTDVLW